MLVGDPAAFTLTVTNPGDGPAEHVRVIADLSAGSGPPAWVKARIPRRQPRRRRIAVDPDRLPDEGRRRAVVRLHGRGRRRHEGDGPGGLRRVNAAARPRGQGAEAAVRGPQGRLHDQGHQPRRRPGRECHGQRHPAGRPEVRHGRRRRTDRRRQPDRVLVPRRGRSGPVQGSERRSRLRRPPANTPTRLPPRRPADSRSRARPRRESKGFRPCNST